MEKNFEDKKKKDICYEEDEIDLYELFLTIKKNYKWVILITFIITLGAVIYAFTATKIYKSEATIFPLGGSKKGGILSALPVDIGISSLKPQSSVTVEAVLKSRTLKERIIRKLNLMPIMYKEQWDFKHKRWKNPEKAPTILDAVKDLKINVETDKKTGVLKISVEFKDPKLAYKILDMALRETDKILNEKSFSINRKYREYVGDRLEKAKRKLSKLEMIYLEFTKGKVKKVPFVIFEEDEAVNNKLLQDGKEYGKLKAELELKKKRLSLLQEENGSKEEIDKLKGEISKLQTNLKHYRKKISAQNFVSPAEYNLNLAKLNMQLSIVKGLLEALSKEYELAKAVEMKEKVSFQIIDPPYIPDKRKPYKPKKKLIVAVAFITGLFLSIFIVFFKEWIVSVRKEHQNQEKSGG